MATSRQTVSAWVAAATDESMGAVFAAIASASAGIAERIRFAGLGDVYGAAGAVNVQGEQQQKLDVYANDTLTEALRAVPSVAGVVSEEDDRPVSFDHTDGSYVAIFDPLDGSSNIDVNVNVGTILGVQRVAAGQDLQAAALQPGSAQAAAVYVVYGPSVVMAVALPGSDGVALFTLNGDGHFMLTAEHVRMPDQGPYYSANESNTASWPDGYERFVLQLRSGRLADETVKPYGARYIGSLVADFHRTLLKGGVFFYPPSKANGDGKLRLLYEANPLAMIAEAAGGAATSGTDRMLDVVPASLHQRTPLVLGSHREVHALAAILRGTAAA